MSDASRVTVAVVGRPNVGKSTLVNRLAGRRVSIAHETAGVTRDRIEVGTEWGGRSFVLVDTGGFIERARDLQAAVKQQTLDALSSSGLVLLVVDTTTGAQQEDLELARMLRRIPQPVVVVANKADSDQAEAGASEFYALGFGDPVAVSSLHGRRVSELLDRIVELLPEENKPQVQVSARFCLVGRPNVGKSSLFNRLVGHERSIVHELAGTTRDAVDTLLTFDGQAVQFVDTAGLRRMVKTQGVEYYGLLRAMRAVERSDVALLVVDAPKGLTGEDKRIAAQVVDAGRGLLAALNKWDLVPSEERAGRFDELARQVQLFAGATVLRTSAQTGSGVGRVVPALLTVREAWGRRVSTSEVNQTIQAAVAAYPSKRARIRYATQVRAEPPTFVLFGSALPEPSYRRYLENAIRRSFDLFGVPIRLSFRTKSPSTRREASRR